MPHSPSRRFPSAAAAVTVAALALACSKGGKPVAKIDGQVVTAGEWTAFLENRGIPPGAPKAELDDALKRLVRRTLSARLAERQGLLKGEDWDAAKREAEESALLQAYLEARDGASLQSTPQEVRAFFLERREARRLKRVVCDSEAKAGEAIQKLKGGAPFEAVAKSHSVDTATAASGGDSGWVRKGELPPPLSDQVFAAKAGELVGPVPVGGAWLIVRVEEIKAPAEEEFTKAKADVVDALRTKKLSEARDRAAKALVSKDPVKVDAAVLGGEPSLEVKPGDDKKIAATAGKVSVSLAEVKRAAKGYFQAAGEPPSPDPELLGKLCEELAVNRQLAAAARADGIDRRPRAKDLGWDGVEEAAARRFAQAHLEKLAVPEATLKSFYEAHREAFSQPAGLRIQMLGAPTPEVLGQAVQALESGAPMDEVVRKLGPAGLQASPEPGTWVPENELAQMVSPKLAEVLTRAPVGKWIGPIPAQGGARALRVGERRAGRTVPFAEAEGQVKGAYLQENGRQLVYDYVDGPGKASFKVETFPENLAQPAPDKGK
jgi:peptidyl-prolyl cis-trans isomerase C